MSSAGTGVGRVLGSCESDLEVLIFGKWAIRQRPSCKAGAVDSRPLLRQHIDDDLVAWGSVPEATRPVAKQFYLAGFGEEMENIDSDDDVHSTGKTGCSEAIEVDGLAHIALLDDVARFSGSEESSCNSCIWGRDVDTAADGERHTFIDASNLIRAQLRNHLLENVDEEACACTDVQNCLSSSCGTVDGV